MILIIAIFLQFFKPIFSEDLLLWNNASDLKYKDFKAQQNDTLKAGNRKYLGAMSAISIEYSTQKLGKYSVPKVTIKNYFNRDNSWMLVKDPYVLQHEQIHFNISELYSRKMRKSVESMRQKNVFDLKIYHQKIDYWNEKNHLASEKFDAENDDYCIVISGKVLFKKNPKQAEWKEKIENGLNVMMDYK